MNRNISRRDFIEGSLTFAAGLSAAGTAGSSLAEGAPRQVGMALAPEDKWQAAQQGLRGSHAGSFETAHQMAFENRSDWGAVDTSDTTEYDLVVIGAGISGLSAAYFYLEAHPGAKVLILDNHDDFGGHAKRNEFNWQDRTILGYGGSQSLEAPNSYSKVASQLLNKLSIKLQKLGDAYDQSFYTTHGLKPAVHFDREHYGQDVTLNTELFNTQLFMPLTQPSRPLQDFIKQMPLSDNARSQLATLIGNEEDRLPDHSVFSEPGYLGTLSYQEFLRKHLGINDPQVLELLKHAGNSYYGYGTDLVPAMMALGMGLPGINSTSLGNISGLLDTAVSWSTEPYIYHFPDGNASVARLLVQQLIPDITAASVNMNSVVTAPFDYAKLDRPGSPVRVRLRSTAVNVEHTGPAKSAEHVAVTYVKDGQANRIKARHAILACYNMAIPHLCPTLPDKQKTALAALVKVPMCSTNVLLGNWHAIKQKQLGMIYSPGRWNKTLLLEFPVSMGSYQFAQTPDDPIMLHSLRGVAGEGDTPESQSRAGRYEMLGMSFDDYEREIRRHLDGLLGDAGFDAARDIAGLTVNRWPHGYAWGPNPLFDDFSDGEAPHEIGRQPFGRISIANSDAGARAYLDCAIDEAWRATQEIG